MKKHTKIFLFSVLGALLLCLPCLGAGALNSRAENAYSYAVEFDRAPIVDIEDRIRMNADGIKIIESDNFYSEHGRSYEIFENNVRYRFKMKIDAEKDGPEYRVFFAGQSQWRSYWLNFNRGAGKLALHSAGGASAGHDMIESTSCSFQIDTSKTFDITLCVIDVLDRGNIVGDRVVASVSDGEKSVLLSYDFLGEDRNGAVREEIYGGATGKSIGVYAYQGVYEIYFLPAEFSRDYVLYVDSGDKKVLHEISYGEAYDFGSDVDVPQGQSLAGFKAVIDGEEKDIPSSGVWTTDITVKTGNLYSARIYPVFTSETHTVTWDLPAGAVAISAPTDVSGSLNNLPKVNVSNPDEAFFGWYKDAEYSERVVLPLAVTYNITLYGKVDDLPEPSEITYVLGDGGVNHADNPTSYTMRDTVSLKAPTREGYFFCGFAEGDGIEEGTTGRKTFTAKWMKDEFPAEGSVFVSQVARRLPLYPVPHGAVCTVSLSFGGEKVAVTDASAVFSRAGEYIATYNVSLPLGGSETRTVTLTAQKVTLSLDNEYKSVYSEGEKIILFDASSTDPMQPITIRVYRNGEETEYKDFSLTLEQGDYKIVYSADGADDISVEFSVKKGNSGGGCNLKRAGFIVLWVALGVVIAGGAVAAAIIINKTKKQNNKNIMSKGEDGNDGNKE